MYLHVGPRCFLIGWIICCALELKSDYCIFVLVLILSVSFYKKCLKKK